jgi:hypothetical protein
VFPSISEIMGFLGVGLPVRHLCSHIVKTALRYGYWNRLLYKSAPRLEIEVTGFAICPNWSAFDVSNDPEEA